MNDQQRIETAADNCEVLRARLARYEDGEGKPITTIAEQAREIERLQLTCNDIDDQNDRIYAELAALKAKPSGVVQRQPSIKALLELCGQMLKLCDASKGLSSSDQAECGLSDAGGDLYFEILNEVARLNQPASGVYSTDPLACTGCVSGCFRCRNEPASGGDDADRAAFEMDFDSRTNCNNGVSYYLNIDGKYCFEDIQNQWEAWQARAVLSAKP